MLAIRLVTAVRRVGVTAIAAATVTASLSCSTPTAPTPPPSASPPRASVAIVSVTVKATADRSAGYAYRVVLRLTESGGAAALIAAVDLTFMNGSSPLVSSRHDRPLADNATIPANGTIETRELETADTDPTHICATSVRASVTFSDSTGVTGTATGVAAVPPPAAPPPQRSFTLAGVVSDAATGRGIEGGAVRVLDGPNAGKSSSTDGNGYYSIQDLSAGSFTVQARANGYEASDRGLTLAEDTRLDLTLRRGDPCMYTVAPSQAQVAQAGGPLTAAVTRTSGGCAWRAVSNASWVTIVTGELDNTEPTLAYAVAANPNDAARTGTITLLWSGGNAQLTITQAGSSPLPPGPPPPVPPPPGPSSCAYAISPSGVNTSEYGGAGTIAITRTAGTCDWQATSNVAWITVGSSSGGGNGTLGYMVGLNFDFSARTGVITIAWAGGSLQLTIAQAGNLNPFCIMFVRVGGQSTLNVGAAGGQFVATFAPILPTPPGLCGAWTASATPPISFVGPIAGLGSGAVTFVVPSNGAHTERTMEVLVEYRDPISLRQTRLTVIQAGAP